jgi:Phage protein Gp138 N-terminal domain
MTGRLGKYTNWEDDIVDQKINNAIKGIWGEIQGKVTKWDPEKQVAEIQPLYKPKHNGKAIDMPVLYDVPVRFERAGKAAVTYPVQEGDFVTLRPMMRSTQNYHTKDEGSASDARAFNPSDYEAHLDGGESLKNPIKNFDSENVHILACLHKSGPP